MGWRWAVLGAVWVGCKPSSPPVDDKAPPVDDTDPVVDTDTDGPPVETDETDAPDGGVPATMDATPIVCVNPALRATERGYALRAREQVLRDGEFNLRGGTVVVADLNGDGLRDPFFPGIREVQLHIQKPGVSFVDESATRLAGIDLTESTGVSLVDVDADGDLDMFVTRWNLHHKLLINDGRGYFTDGTAAAGLAGTPRRYQTSVWGDLDRDGDLDLFVGGYGPRPVDAHAPPEGFEEGDPSELWRNNGDGTFTEISEVIPEVVHLSHTFMAGFHDLDLDGWDELLIINDFGWNRPSRIFWNTPTGLVMDDGSAGFDIPFAGMGLGVGDLNGDQIPEFVQSSWKKASLLSSAGGSWWESALAAGILPDPIGLRNQVFGWGTELGDLDNDGDEDLIINYGWWDDYGPNFLQEDAVFLQTSHMVFQDGSSLFRMTDRGVSRGLVMSDLNNDGWLDVVKRILDDRTPMYVSNCGREGWLRITTRAPAPNTFAIGARIRVTNDGVVWTRQIRTGGTGMYSAYEPEAHFGLGNLDRVQKIEVIWPGGEISTFRDVDTRQVLKITRL